MILDFHSKPFKCRREGHVKGKNESYLSFSKKQKYNNKKQQRQQNKNAVVEVGNHMVCTDRRKIWSGARDGNSTQNEKRGTRKIPGTWNPQCNSGVL